MSKDTSLNNSHIAKNTLVLYLRMFLMFAISLYTSRVVLRTLGVVDYGINDVVGGIISIFSFLSGTLIITTQRYISYYLGNSDNQKLSKVWSMCLNIHILLAIVIIILGETIGLWFLYEKMVIPADRMTAAVCVYHLSILSAVVNIISMPYNATIIAHERMSIFAYFSLLEAVFRLLMVFLLSIIPFDKLILFAILTFSISLLMRLLYGRYCSLNFDETHYHFYKDKNLFKEITYFAGWNIWGALAAVLNTQGLNMLLNVFFGPVVNASRGIAVQVQNAVIQFSQNFQMAINPQITKKYAAGELKTIHKLIFRCSKFTFMLLYMIMLPIILETPFIFGLWLGVDMVPKYTVAFTRIILCITIVDATANPFMTAAAANGDVKVYQSVIGGILLLTLPISYLFLKSGTEPWAVFIVHLLMCLITFVVRLIIVKPMINLSINEYLRDGFLPCLYVLFLSTIIPFILHLLLPMTSINSILIIIISVVCIVSASYFAGLTYSERAFVKEKVNMLTHKFLKNRII